MHNNLFNPIDIGEPVNWSTEQLVRDRAFSLNDERNDFAFEEVG